MEFFMIELRHVYFIVFEIYFSNRMTSWITKTAPVKPKQPTFSYYFQTTEAGLCSNFNGFLYSAIHAQRQGDILYVHDKPNCVGANFTLFETILRENANIIYLKNKPTSGKNYMENISQTSGTLANTSIRRVREMAQNIFWYNPETQERIRVNLENRGISRTVFDAGVHIRSGDKITTGEMKEVPISKYIDHLRTIQRRLNKKTLSVFVMTDNYKLFEELKKAGEPSWTYTSFVTNTPYFANGHVQLDFNLLPAEERVKLFYQFLTELWVMQNIANLVVSYSSNVGRFLYIMNRRIESADSILSVDVPTWSPF